MKRNDVQFTTGGRGIAHSEQNEHSTQQVHFLQIWVTPWKSGLKPRYHTRTFDEKLKRNGKFITILSPLKGGVNASAKEEEEAAATVEGTIPIHADFLMGATILDNNQNNKTAWKVGGGDTEEEDAVVRSKKNRKVYFHLPMRGTGARIRIAAQVELGEGDGAFVEGVNAGEKLEVESTGSGEAEVVVLDSN
ncbi:MAG: hypothetical protein Q9190_006941 [Brigantiaea leucoxantha]